MNLLKILILSNILASISDLQFKTIQSLVI